MAYENFVDEARACENEFIEIRNEWNKKRIETKDEKNRRESEEILEEINDKLKLINTINFINARFLQYKILIKNRSGYVKFKSIDIELK